MKVQDGSLVTHQDVRQHRVPTCAREPDTGPRADCIWCHMSLCSVRIRYLTFHLPAIEQDPH